MEIIMDETAFKVLRACISAVSPLIEEARFKFSQEGVSMRAMDPSHVVLADLSIPAGAFQKYLGEAGAGISLKELGKILARVGGPVSLTLDSRLTVEGGSGNGVKKKFTLPLVDAIDPSIANPTAFTAAVVVDTQALRQAIEDAGAVGGTVKFSLSPSGLAVTAEGDGKAFETSIPATVPPLPSPVRVMYPVSYLEHIVKPSIASTVKLGLAPDYPLELSYSVLGGHLRFFLAPRVEE